jgi:2-dehydropantoate 2-reductase
MRVLVVGGGGLGAVVAGRLARIGNDVTLVVKPAQAAAFPSQAVQVTGIAEFTAPLRVASNPAGLGPFDSVIICVKGRDSSAALEPLRGLEVETVLSLQNGVKKDETLGEFFGRERVLGALAFVSGELQRPGLVLNTAAQGLYIGELDGSASARAERLAAAIRESGIPSESVPDIRKREWDKLTLYVCLALVGGATRLDTLTVISDLSLMRVCVRIAVETASVAAAEGVALDVTEDRYAETLEAWARPIREKGMLHYMSLVQDLMAGRPTELEAIAGDVIERARRHRVPVPTIEVLTDLVRGVEAAVVAARTAAGPG